MEPRKMSPFAKKIAMLAAVLVIPATVLVALYHSEQQMDLVGGSAVLFILLIVYHMVPKQWQQKIKNFVEA